MTSEHRPQDCRIDATARIDAGAVLGQGVWIGPYCVIGKGVEIGAGARVGAHVQIGGDNPLAPEEAGEIAIGPGARIGGHCILTGKIALGASVTLSHGVTILGDVRVGDRSEIHSGAVIGGPGQFPGRHDARGQVRIGSDVIIREQCCVTRSVLTEATRVGDGCYLMSRTQIDHDCVLGANVKTAAGVTLGGSVTVEANAYLGMNAVVHQARRIGPGTMIGMNGAVMRHVPPFATIVSGQFTKLNVRGLKLRGASDADIAAIAARYSEAAPAPGEAGENRFVQTIDAFFDEIASDDVMAYKFRGVR